MLLYNIVCFYRTFQKTRNGAKSKYQLRDSYVSGLMKMHYSVLFPKQEASNCSFITPQNTLSKLIRLVLSCIKIFLPLYTCASCVMKYRWASVSMYSHFFLFFFFEHQCRWLWSNLYIHAHVPYTCAHLYTRKAIAMLQRTDIATH